MRRRWARWVALFDAREDGHALALFRVALGLTVFIDVAWPAWAGVWTRRGSTRPTGAIDPWAKAAGGSWICWAPGRVRR
jgi:hypothetical protein